MHNTEAATAAWSYVRAKAASFQLFERHSDDTGAFSVPVALMLMIVGVAAAATFGDELDQLITDAIEIVSNQINGTGP